MMRIKDGITFGEFNSMNEGLLLTHREDTPPEEKVIKESLPFVQGDYDFSRILGEAIRENRLVRYEFFIKEYNHDKRKMLEIKYENMLLNQGMGRIYDTANLGYYFYGKCLNAEVVLDGNWQQLKLIATFDCYSYMISELPEGHDIWDEFNFELDVAQPITFHPMRSTFRPLGIGDTITIGVWSGQFDGLGKIEHGLLGRSYKVGSVRSTTQGDSARAYYISELGEWLIEQDAVESQEGAVEVNLINAGTSSVAPTIETDIDLTIIREDGDVFNLKKGTINSDLFRLYPGENKMIISGWTKTRYEPGNVKLTWHKELI